jgi:hypothetical protein
MFLKHTNLQKKNDMQQKQGGEKMLLHFLPKSNLKKVKNSKVQHHVQI